MSQTLQPVPARRSRRPRQGARLRGGTPLSATQASYAHDDPWTALLHSAAIQEIFDARGGEVISVEMQLMKRMNPWYRGALAPAVQPLERIPVADTAPGIASSP